MLKRSSAHVRRCFIGGLLEGSSSFSLESTATIMSINEEEGETLVEIAIETKNQDGVVVITGSAIALVS